MFNQNSASSIVFSKTWINVSSWCCWCARMDDKSCVLDFIEIVPLDDDRNCSSESPDVKFSLSCVKVCVYFLAYCYIIRLQLYSACFFSLLALNRDGCIVVINNQFTCCENRLLPGYIFVTSLIWVWWSVNDFGKTSILIPFWATFDLSYQGYQTIVCLSCPVCLSVLWRWCIVAKWLDGSRWNLACR